MKIAYNPITSGALSTAPDNNDITFDLRGLNIFVKGVKFKGTDTTYSVFKKHTSSSGGGYNGLVPVPSYTSTNIRFLREDGTWQIPSSQYTYSQLTNQDLDTLKTEGKWFYLASDNTVTNGPTNINGGGELYVGRNAFGFRYQKVISVDGLIWFRKWNSQSWSPWKRWYTDANTDSKVLQSNTTTTNYRPVILGYNNSTSTSNLSNNITEQVYTTTAIYAQPSTGNLWANKLYSGGKPVLTEHQSLANYVTLNTTQIITGSKTFSNPINSSFISSTHLDANKGRTIINSTANAGSYTMLFKGNSTNGYFTHGVYQGKYLLQYTTKATVDAGTNAVTKSVILLDESGNSQFSGSIYAPKFIGSLQGNADSATKLTTSAGSSSLPVYFLEGKPLACSPSSLFSNLSNSGNNISVTVAGQNRTLTINYANEANKLYSYGLPYSGSDKRGWYCKIASISLTSRYSSKSALLCITDECTTSNYPRYGFIYVKVQQQEELGTSPNITLRISGSLTTSLVTGILTLSSSSSKLDIYLKEDQHYQRGYVSFIHGKEDIRTNSQELIQTLPQGTIINSQYGDISNQTLSLLNSRKINGTSFNGTTDITTSYWGPTRTITLTGAVTGTVSTNGSGNIIINTTYDTNNISDLDSRYVNITGDTMTGTLTVSTKGTGSYNQGIRINRTAADQWATLTIGNVGTGTFGTSDNTWLIGTPGNSNSLIFNRNSANENSGLCLKGHGNTDMKWNNNTVWHAGNDGSGSGLDADLLDGVHLNAIFTELNYSKSRLTATIGTVKKTVNVTGSYPNINNVTMNTIASYGNCMGIASLASSNSNVNPNNQTSWHHFINMSYDTSPNNMWQSQIAIRAGTTEVWVRSRSGGTVQDNQAWQAPWVRLARTTDNVASATNADKLDGIHANELLTALTSNSTTNLSLTVGGTTKTIADLYATQAVNADTVDNLHASSFMRCDGTNGISLTGGNDNTSGWRLVLERQCGGQTINNIVLSVTSRHSGQGVLSIGFHTTNDTGTSYTYSINFKGSTASINSGAWRAFYNTSTKKFRLFWHHWDYNYTYINVLNRIGFYEPKNGTWYETLPTDNGTELIIRYNTADKLGTSTVGNSTTPIYLNGGTPTICSVSTSGNANTIAIRDGSGDLQCRLVRATYANQTSISGALAFRVNNSSDNYIRFCSDRDVIRTWLGAAASSHNHDSTYVNVTGDIMTGNLTFSDTGTSSYPIESKGIKWNGGTNSASIFYRLQSSDQGNLVFRTGDDTNCYFIWENANGSSLTQWMTLKGNTLTVSNLNGNASTTTKLQTARQINGTNFDGTANITTAKWGTARSIKIGNTAKNVDGSGNVSWSLSEIGAAAANHAHNYIVSRGNLDAQTGRTQNLGDVYSYSTTSSNTGGPTTYTSVIGFGRGAYGTVEIAGGQTSDMGLWYRALREVEDNWRDWRKVWDTGNFNPSNYSLTSHNHDDRYVNVTGDTMTGRLTFNDGGIATSTTTSLQLGMYTPTHIYLQTAGTLYYSPKSGTNYRIWHEGNFNPNNYMRAVNANGYYGMATPQGDTSAWIRTTSSGILPFQKGDSTFGHCSIGSSTWYFYSAYIQNIHSYRMEASDGFYQQSDIRLKENIQKITSMSNIELVEFMWKKDKKKSYGVIAQQVEKYFPELVNIDKETGYKSVNYDAILIIKIAQLENKIKQLESKLL